MKAEIYPIDGVRFGRLAIMPRPRAGDWLRGEVESWQQAGVSCVVSLLEPAEVIDLGLQHEAEICRQIGLEFLDFPIPDRGVPHSDGDLAALVECLASRLHAGQGVAIHCRIGVGRSALVAACVLASLGQPLSSVWQSIEKARALSVPDTPEQKAWVTTFCSGPAKSRALLDSQ